MMRGLALLVMLVTAGPLTAWADHKTPLVAFAGCLIENEARSLAGAVVEGETLMPMAWPSCRAFIPFLAKAHISHRAVAHFEDTEGNPFFLALHKNGPSDLGIWVLIWDFSTDIPT